MKRKYSGLLNLVFGSIQLIATGKRDFVLFSGLFLITLLSCKKEAIVVPPFPAPPQDNTPYLEIKWERQIVASLNYRTNISAPPHLFGGKVIIDSEFPDTSFASQTFFQFDTSDGSLMSTWYDYSNGPSFYYNDLIAQKDRYLVLGSQNAVDVIDMSNGQTQWGHRVPNGYAGVYTYGNYVYKGADTDNWGQIWRGHLETGLWEMVYHHNKEQGFKPFFVGIEHTVAPNGDELVIWKNWSLKGMTQNRTEFFCYNLTHDSLMWRSEQFMVTSNVYPPKRANDVVLGLLENSVVGFDLMTGQTLWEADLRQGSSCPNRISTIHAGIHVNQDRAIIAYTSCPEVVVLNTSDGAQIHRWRLNTDKDYSSIEGKFTHYNGKLFFVSQAELQVIDDYTGQPLFDPKRLNHLGGRLWNGVAIDSATQSMYIHNGQKLFCLRIPPDLR